jgi:hypothetical protein
MPNTRQQICQQAARKLQAAASRLPRLQALVGPDGFVDSIIEVVETRQSPTKYSPIPSIEALGHKITAASGHSANFELVVKLQKLGGNGPIMANALAGAGCAVTYVGMLGYPKLHPVFRPLAERARALSIAEPGYTDALEFTDGKLLLGKHAGVREVTWANLLERVGEARLEQCLRRSSLIAMVNWTMLPYLTDIWKQLHQRFLKRLPGREGKVFFADLCDPAKRSPEDIRAAMSVLGRIGRDMPVTLGLNLSEAVQVARMVGLREYPQPEKSIEEMAVDLRSKLGLACVAIHPRGGAAAAVQGRSASITGPYVQRPKLSTGAGDNFNAGLCLGQLLGLELEESLAVAVATSGYYVRHGASPTAAQLARFVAKLPEPEGV